MTYSEARVVACNAPVVYVHHRPGAAPLPMRWVSYRIGDWGVTLMESSSGRTSYVPLARIRHPTPEELLTLDWPSWPSRSA